MAQRIYFDHNATSPVRPCVHEAIDRFLSDPLANASSVHTSGRRMRKAIEDAREAVAKWIGAKPSEVIFTSGGTESNHLAWRTFFSAGKRIVTSRVEHPCVLGAAKQAEQSGVQITWISVDANGHWNRGDLDRAISDPPDFISLQHANNETGVVWPVEELAAMCKGTKTVIHTDAVQSVGKAAVQLQSLGVHLLSLSGHKLGALPGTGALIVRRGTPFTPIWDGGHQEKGRRTGTENVLGIVALGAACKWLRAEGENENRRIATLRDAFERELMERIPGVAVTASAEPRLPNTAHIIFDGVDGESLLIAADLAGIDCSTGSACASGSLEPSHVLLAMGFSPARAHSSIRFSFGWNTTEEEIARALDVLPRLVHQVRASLR